jgi:hypothetical protein
MPGATRSKTKIEANRAAGEAALRHYEQDQEAVRANTERLRLLRLAKEAERKGKKT